jgi:ribosomal protein S18 acetylase RimI-like enzyme
MSVEVIVADYQNSMHADDIIFLLDQYANDPMGGAEPLSEYVKANLMDTLAKRSDALSLLCYVDGVPAGLANCFESFSTFKCKPLINIHDLMVAIDFRGLGISQLMLSKIESIAREKQYCKITLEVLGGNEVAKAAYLKYGFEPYQLDSNNGAALFWQKKIK